MAEIPDCIEREVVIPAPIDRVWRLVTDPIQIARWYPGAAIEPREGAAATFECGADAPYHGLVDRVDPPHALAWRWCLAPGKPVGQGPTTRVETHLVMKWGAHSSSSSGRPSGSARPVGAAIVACGSHAGLVQ